MLVTKRNGTQVQFDLDKIAIAICKAFIAQGYGEAASEAFSKSVSLLVKTEILKTELNPIHIEKIQDLVENALMKSDFGDVAKAYILYRAKHAEQRREHPPSPPESDVNYFNGDIMGEFVFYRTYARWREQDGRRETWPEAVDRYVSFMRSKLGDKLPKDEYDMVRQAILTMKVMPSMRLLQFAGPAAERCNVTAYNCSYIAPESPRDLSEIIYILMSGCGVGFSVEAHHVDKFPICKDFHAKDFGPIIIPDSKEGWADSFRVAMEFWLKGIDVILDYSQLRPAGARLKTTGGRSSGPQPLKDLMNFTRELIISKAGQKLSPLNIHDIVCKIGQIVVAGGVRRSALISLSDLSNAEIRDCKDGPIWNTAPQRYMSNNSAVYNEVPNDIDFMTEWLKLTKSGTGERGIFSRAGLEDVLPTRRVQLLGERVKHLGANPCVTADTWIQTVHGPLQVKDLIGNKVPLLVNGSLAQMESEGFFYTGDKQVFKVTTSCGYTLKITDNHKLFKVGSIGSDEESEWVELKDLKVGNLIGLSTHIYSLISCAVLWFLGLDAQKEAHDAMVDADQFPNKMPNEKGSLLYVIYYLRSVFSLIDDKSAVLSLEKPNLELLQTLQRMLSRIGRTCNVFSETLIIVDQTPREYDKIVKIEPLGVEPVYDVTVSGVHEFCANGIRAHNCGEILLQSKQFCNLTEVVCRKGDTLETLKEKIHVASLLGTFQSTLVDFNYLSPEWKRNVEDERLLGVSLTGIMDCELLAQGQNSESYTFSDVIGRLRNSAILFNEHYAKVFGVNPSTAVTAVKPSGTVSQMVNCSSGIHARYAPYYIRRIRIAAHDPLFALMKDQGFPHTAEVGQDPENPNTWVLEFPVASPKGAICTANRSALEQLEFWKQFKLHYTEHNPSVTISVKSNEWLEIQHWISKNWKHITGLSFLPYSEHVYTLAPYEEITEAEYLAHPCRGKRVNFSKLSYYEKVDTTDVKKEFACTAAGCEL